MTVCFAGVCVCVCVCVFEGRGGEESEGGSVRVHKTENEGDDGWQPGQCGADVAVDDGH